jgi:molybdopterin-binding protein
MLRVENLSRRLGGFAIQDVTFEVERGAYFVLLGASGVGKTLVLEMIAGLAPPDAGRVELDGVDITRTRVQDRGLGLVYQDQALFPHLTVRRNIAYGLHGKGLGHAVLGKRVLALAEQVGVQGLLDRHPGTLSGGEAQRVALARTLAVAPRCLLLDEPLSSLDPAARGGLRGLLRQLHREGQTVVHVTHDYDEALSLATRIGVMERGTVVQTGAPSEVFQHPKSEFVARFAGIRNAFAGRLDAAEHANGPCRFTVDTQVFQVLTEHPPGPGQVVFRSEDVTLSRVVTDTSAQNTFSGTVRDVFPARLGMEVVVGIGVDVAALVTNESVERLQLRPGAPVWVSLKASAIRFIPE